MKKVNIQELKSNFPLFLAELYAGRSLLLCSRNVPVAEMRPIPQKNNKKRKLGQFKNFFKFDQKLFDLEDQQITQDFMDSIKKDLSQ